MTDTPPAARSRLATPGRFDVAVRIVSTLVAVGVLFILVPHSWYRAYGAWLMLGKLSRVWTFWFLGLLAVVCVATWLAKLRPLTWRRLLLVASACLPVWMAINWLVWRLLASPMSHEVPLIALYTTTSLWLLWLWAMVLVPWNWKRRAIVLAVLWLATPAFSLAMNFRGLDGDGRLILVWRFIDQPIARPPTPPPPSTEVPAAHATLGLEFPEYRGPGRLSTLHNLALDRDWEHNPPRELWRRPIGPGWGSFAIAHGQAITQEQRGELEAVACYELLTGRELWVHLGPTGFASAPVDGGSMGGTGPRATPTLDGDRVYTLGATGALHCLDRAMGELHWTVDILEDNDASNLSHGMCGSPLVVDHLVVVCPGGANGRSLVAYDKHTGAAVWRSGDRAAAYASPQLVAIEGRRNILIHDAEGVSAYSVDKGAPLWHHPWSNDQAVNCSQPVPLPSDPARLLLTTGYGLGAALIRVTPADTPSWTVETLWTSRSLKTKLTSAVVHGNHAYGLDDGILACIDLTDGRRCWKAGRYGHGQLLLVDDLLLVQAETGEVVLLAADPHGLREWATLPALSSKCWNVPALAGPYLLLRNDREAVCYELPLKPNVQR